jgi:hypothetical protein
MRAKRSATPLVLTAPEVAAVVSRLEDQACSVRRVRYLLSGLPATDPTAARGEVRLYGPADVALMRLAVRLEARGVSAWVAQEVLAYRADEIRAAWRAGAPAALQVRGVTGSIEMATRDTDTPPGVVRVPLRPVFVGIASAIRRERRARPTIWRWRARATAALAQDSA